MSKKAIGRKFPDHKPADASAVDNIDNILNSIDALISVSNGTAAQDGARHEDSGILPAGVFTPETLAKQGFGDAQISEIMKGQTRGLDVRVYARTCYDWMQMQELRKGLARNLDVKMYDNPLYAASQMREIRLGLENHLNVSAYAKLMLAATDMNRIRKVLLSEAYKASPHGFAKNIEDDPTGILIRIGDDCMDAYMSIPAAVNQDFTRAELIQILKSHEVCHGFVDANLDKLAKEKLRDKELCVAKGKSAIEGRAGRYELFFQNAIDNSHIVMPDEEIDYSDVGTIETVTPGQLLARYHYSQKDVDGMTVTGILIEGKKGAELPKLTGKGFINGPGQEVYHASEKGYVFYNATTYTLRVEKIYEVNEDVNYLKSFEYDGTIYVHGSVRGKSTIRASGSIIIDGFVEDACIYAGQNVVIKSGCNGNEHGIIESGGSVHGKFFENITVKAKGLVEGNYFLNCVIQTDDRVLARGRKARITGGNITAVVSIEAVILGNYLGTKAQCSVGDTASILKQTAALLKKRADALEKVDKLTQSRQKLLKMLGEQAATGNTLYNQALAAIEAENSLIADLNHEMERLELVVQRAKKAYIHIHSEVAEDVILKLGGKPCKLKNPSRKGIMLTMEKLINLSGRNADS